MFVDKTEISKHRELSRSVRDDKINPHIEDAQLLDLKPLIGEALYNAIDGNLSEARIVDIMQPKEYTYKDKTYKHQGLNKVISLFSYARYILHGAFTDTGFGLVQKSNQDSQPVSDAQKKAIYTKDRQTATAYFNEVSLFLSRNAEVYPEWNSGCEFRRPKFRISKITK